MKVSLVVRTSGKMFDKAIPVAGAQFLIGRDPQCNLRPSTPLVSGRHCAVLTSGDAVSVRDFNSTNGTFVNGERVAGERALRDGDRLRLGPLEFDIRLEASPAPPARRPVPGDEAAAALLLALDDGTDAVPRKLLDENAIPAGTTLMDMPAPKAPEPTPVSQSKGGGQSPKNPLGDTSTAATNLLQKYLRRRGT